jgi:hypothetical protein
MDQLICTESSSDYQELKKNRYSIVDADNDIFLHEVFFLLQSMINIGLRSQEAITLSIISVDNYRVVVTTHANEVRKVPVTSVQKTLNMHISCSYLV